MHVLTDPKRTHRSLLHVFVECDSRAHDFCFAECGEAPNLDFQAVRHVQDVAIAIHLSDAHFMGTR